MLFGVVVVSKFRLAHRASFAVTFPLSAKESCGVGWVVARVMKSAVYLSNYLPISTLHSPTELAN